MARPWTPAPALVRLSIRRALGPIFLLWCAVVGLSLAMRDWAPATAALGAPSPDEARWIAHGLVRQGIWSGVAIALLPFLILRAARTVGQWRTGEVDWLASRATSRSAILAWTWLGSWIAALCVLAATGLLAEARSGESVPSLRLAGQIGGAGSSWVEGRHPVAWRAPDPGDLAPPGSRARFDLALGSGSGPGVLVILRARRIAGAGGESRPGTRGEKDAEKVTQKRVGTRSSIEVELPPGAGDLELAISCADDGDRVFLMSKAGELWAPVASDRAASWTIFARAAVALSAWLALALGLGAWMQATSAAVLVLALMLPLWMAPESSPIWPGADLVDALAIAARGRVPPAIDGRSVLASVLVTAAGLGLARWSLARWRRES